MALAMKHPKKRNLLQISSTTPKLVSPARGAIAWEDREKVVIRCGVMKNEHSSNQETDPLDCECTE